MIYDIKISLHLSLSIISLNISLSIISPNISLSLSLSVLLLPSEGVSHEESWSFYPNAVRTAGFCGNPSFHLYWPNKNQDGTHNILATRELIVQPGYILQFKVLYQLACCFEET